MYLMNYLGRMINNNVANEIILRISYIYNSFNLVGFFYKIP